ncbi:MAG: glycosyltransferase family 2 protein [Geobacteraceae bacterium]|nr:glycosyltransferase family 2 protein [Geobacteraceae bacterium]
MSAPLVSICIPTYNNARFLAEALESVLIQRSVDFEVIIIDDCSTDTTASIAHEFASRDGRIAVRVNEQNIGMVPNWNRCMALSRGTYIKFLFGDDLLSSPETLWLMVEAMQRTPGTVLVSCARTLIDAQSYPFEHVSHFPGDFTSDGRDVIRRCVRRMTRHHNLIGEPSAVLFRRDAADRGFDLRYQQLVDLEMCFHLLEQGAFSYLGTPLCSFRHHEGQQTKKNAVALNFIEDIICLFREYLCKPYVGISRSESFYLTYYQFYKLLKHARQGQHDMALVQEKIQSQYGMWKFYLLRPYYRLYTPYWQMKRMIAKRLGRE